MKLIRNIISHLFAIFLLVSCGNNKTSDTMKTGGNTISNPLDGAWEIKRAEGSMQSSNLGTVYTFDGNTLTFGKGGFKNPGTTEITDSTFSFQADGNSYKFMYNYHFNGDTLVVEMQKSNGQVFHMVKK